MKFVLASNSPRRKELLKGIGLKFDIVPSNIEEATNKSEPSDVVIDLSKKKASDVSKRINNDSFIIAADTVVEIDGDIFGKPKDRLDAYNMLKKLNGKWHKVFTGITVIDKSTSKMISDYESTDVFMKKLNDEMINHYIDTGESYDKAGAYAIQGYGSLLIERINGDYFNVVGLPLSKLYDMFYKYFGISLL